MTSFGEEFSSVSTKRNLKFYPDRISASTSAIFKYRTKEALILAGDLKENEFQVKQEEGLESFASKGAGKLKAGKSGAKGASAVVDDDDDKEEDVKSLQKKSRDWIGGSRDEPFDLTAL